MKTLNWALLAVAFSIPAPAQTWNQTSAPSNQWRSVVSSADGSMLAAAVNGGGIYSSTNSGFTWQLTGAPTNGWRQVASSADGVRLVAAAGLGGIFTSVDSGTTWISNNVPTTNWQFVASSADGTSLMAAVASASGPAISGGIYISTNSGADWTLVTGLPGSWWLSIAAAANGQRLYALAWEFPQLKFYTSTDSGETWITNDAPYDRQVSVACSPDGSTLAMAISGGLLISTNQGVSWSTNGHPGRSVAMSADGSKFLVGSLETYASIYFYTSTDSGWTWITNDLPRGAVIPGVSPFSGCLSADGSKAFVGGPNGGIYTSQATPTPQLSLAHLTNGLVLSWVETSADFVLQRGAELATTNWETVTNEALLNLTTLQNEVVLPITGDAGYYRLRAP